MSSLVHVVLDLGPYNVGPHHLSAMRTFLGTPCCPGIRVVFPVGKPAVMFRAGQLGCTPDIPDPQRILATASTIPIHVLSLVIHLFVV